MKKALIVVLGIFVVALCYANVSDYLDEHRGLKYKGVTIIENTGIGREWTFECKVNGDLISEGDTIEAADGIYYIRVRAIEDDQYPDVGSETIVVRSSERGNFKVDVKVTEKYGPGAGGYAIVRFLFKMK